MKQMVCVISLLIMLIVNTVIPANASEIEIIDLDDGTYITVELETIDNRASGSVTGKKVYTHYGDDGVSNWKAVLTGSYTYTGSSSTCTSSSADVTIYDSSWYVISKSAGKSGNKATASLTMGEKVLGVTVTRIPVSLTLSCDADGNLS